MSRVINLDTIRVPPGLASVATAQPALQGTPPANWDTDNFSRVPIWSNVELDDAQVLTLGASLFNEISTDAISAQTAVKCLRLAMSLKSMEAGNTNRLIVPQVRPVAGDNPLPAVNIPAINLFSNTPFTLRNIERPIGTQQEGPAVVVNQPSTNANVNADSNERKQSAYSFVAMFLMRLVVKSSDNVTQGLANMKLRYETFYGPSTTMSSFSINLQQAATLKDALCSQTLIGQTFTHAVANTHQNNVGNLTQHEIGVLSYLCFLPFSYTGMHAYTMITELKYATNISLAKLLALFYCDITAPAINKIVDIVNLFERTEANPDRDVTFRYCTLWAPHYFAAVRSRNSVHLVYTVACAWKTLKSGGTNSDPENIAAVGTLSATMKRTLKRAGTIIGEALKSKMLTGENASEAFQMALEPENDGDGGEMAINDDDFDDL